MIDIMERLLILELMSIRKNDLLGRQVCLAFFDEWHFICYSKKAR